MKNRIGWCDMTWNPCWGCRNHCEYCYARKMAKRFYKVMGKKEYDPNGLSLPGDGVSLKIDYLKRFVPRFLYSQFNKKFPKKPQRIFVGSMSEIYYWEKEWIRDVLDKILEYPQHTFQFLTKHPRVYSKWVWPKNCWLGVTIAQEAMIDLPAYRKFEKSNVDNLKFINFEPLFYEIELDIKNISWIIVGAETGNRKGKFAPYVEWVDDIVSYCKGNKIPVYIKDNLTKYYPQFEGYKEFPREVGL